MKPAKSRLCLYCEGAFHADRRNASHQKYCSAAACRRASKAASQRLWIAKPENQSYHRGPEAVARVRSWQDGHPEYRERQKARRAAALQDLLVVQVLEFKQESDISSIPEEIPAPALQDFMNAQPLVFIGLIAHFFNITLQEAIPHAA